MSLATEDLRRPPRTVDLGYAHADRLEIAHHVLIVARALVPHLVELLRNLLDRAAAAAEHRDVLAVDLRSGVKFRLEGAGALIRETVVADRTAFALGHGPLARDEREFFAVGERGFGA